MKQYYYFFLFIFINLSVKFSGDFCIEILEENPYLSIQIINVILKA